MSPQIKSAKPISGSMSGLVFAQARVAGLAAVLGVSLFAQSLFAGWAIATPGKKTTHTVTSIKAKKISDDKFKVPTGYEGTSMLPRHEPRPVAK